MLECAAASAAQTKLRATEGAQLRLKTYVMRHPAIQTTLFLMLAMCQFTPVTKGIESELTSPKDQRALAALTEKCRLACEARLHHPGTIVNENFGPEDFDDPVQNREQIVDNYFGPGKLYRSCPASHSDLCLRPARIESFSHCKCVASWYVHGGQRKAEKDLEAIFRSQTRAK